MFDIIGNYIIDDVKMIRNILVGFQELCSSDKANIYKSLNKFEIWKEILKCLWYFAESK